MYVKLKILAAILITVAILASGCLSVYEQDYDIDILSDIYLETGPDLKKFNNSSEVIDFLEAAGRYGGMYSYGYGGRGDVDMMAVEEGAPIPAPTPADVAKDYSTTNIQVAGVDEADFVKNDDEYIYLICEDKLVIIDAYPAEDARIVSETEVDGTARDMYLNKDRLAVLTQDYDEVYVIADYDYIPRPRSLVSTHLYVYDISERSDPEEVKDYMVSGSYYQSRMIGDYVYFITTEYPYYYGGVIDLPVVKESSKTVLSPDVYYFENPEDDYNFNTIASVDIMSDEDDVNAKTFLMGYSNSLYVSKNNIYITYQKNPSYRYYDALQEERFYDAVVPLLPYSAKSEIERTQEDDTLNSYEKWDEIRGILEDMYSSMDEEDKDDLIEKIEGAVAAWDSKLEAELRKTVIQKFAIKDGRIEYEARGEVKGYPLNQFSMDEYNGYFRIATTTSFWMRNVGSVEYNNLFVLDEDMEVVGSLEKLAEDERIYSTRFIGDRLYMVTFKRMDPLFVIDLSNPTDPAVLGELKIPGFSDYLHPYDENHIIGMGKETGSNEWSGVSIKGVKLALFDVSDPGNPKEIDKYEIGTSGTDSEALRDHKAFLFDREKNILVIPIHEVEDGYARERVWQGAYVFSLSVDEGFDLKGRISHFEGDENGCGYWGSPSAVRRSLYMDDVLYTISAKLLKMNDIETIEEINEMELPCRGYEYSPYPLR